MDDRINYRDGTAGPVFWMVLAIFVECLQLLIMATVISGFVPVHAELFVAQNFDKTLPTLKIDRQISLYRGFVLANIALAGIFLGFFRRKLDDAPWIREVRIYTAVQAVLVALELFASFKIIVYKSPPWAWGLLWAGMGLAVAARIFWPEVRKGLDQAWQVWLKADPGPWIVHGWDALVLVLLAACIYAPGLAPAKAIKPAMLLGIAYFAVCYAFLRTWLRSVCLATAGVLLAVKLHLFNVGIAPVVWGSSHKTFLRYIWDAAVLWALAGHARKADARFLWLASVGTGLSLIYRLDTGLTLLAAFYAYLGLYAAFAPAPKVRTKGFFVMPFVTAFVLWLMHGRPAIALPAWPPPLPFFDCLRGLQFFAFVMAFIIPLVYLTTLLVAGTEYILRNRRQDPLAIVLSIYGLGLYQYFVWHSALDNFYSVGMPFVFLLCYWFERATQTLDPRVRRIAGLCAVALTLMALLTNQLFMYYHSITLAAK